MRRVPAVLAAALSLAACTDDEDVPGSCGAMLGDACDADAGCDMGLTCGPAGRCECTGETCALACWTDRAVAEIVADGEMLYVLATLDAGGWEVTSVLTRGGLRRRAALGAGAARIAGYNGDLFVAAGAPDAFDTLITRRLPDGDQITQLAASLPEVHGLTASARGVAYSTDGALWQIDPVGTPTQLASGPDLHEPRALVLDGDGDLIYIAHDDASADAAVRLAGSPAARTVLGTADDLGSLAACPGAIYWSAPAGAGVRLDRASGATAPFGDGLVDEIACVDATTYWLGTDGDDGSLDSRRRAIVERAGAGAARSRYVVPFDREVFAPHQLAVDAGHLYWSFGSSEIHRVMRLDR